MQQLKNACKQHKHQPCRGSGRAPWLPGFDHAGDHAVRPYYQGLMAVSRWFGRGKRPSHHGVVPHAQTSLVRKYERSHERKGPSKNGPKSEKVVRNVPCEWPQVWKHPTPSCEGDRWCRHRSNAQMDKRLRNHWTYSIRGKCRATVLSPVHWMLPEPSSREAWSPVATGDWTGQC